MHWFRDHSTRISLIALLLFAGFAVGLVAPAWAAQEPTITYGGPFEMVDHTGKTVTDADYRGDYLLVYFGYTNCPDVCPTGLATMAAALRQLKPELAEQVQPIFITVDAKRDTPDKLAPYVKAFHPRMVGLTGSAEQIFNTAREYRVRYFTGMYEGNYVVEHTAYFYLMGPDGKYIQYFAHDISAGELAKALEAELKG